jgi:hypothetical protein
VGAAWADIHESLGYKFNLVNYILGECLISRPADRVVREANGEATWATSPPQKKNDNGQAFRTSGKPGRWMDISCLQISPFFFDEGADAFGQKGDVEGLLERLVEAEVQEGFRGRFVLTGQRHDERMFVLGVAAEVLGNLHAFATAHGQVDDDGIGMKAFGLDASLEAAGR